MTYQENAAAGAAIPDSGNKLAASNSADRTLSPQAKWNKAHPLERWAHRALRSALKMDLIEQVPCEVCGSEDSEAHHPDYDRPLMVKWLCRKHHKREHMRLRESKTDGQQ